MSSDGSENKDGDPLDVVLVHGKALDGDATRVLRIRPGRMEAGEVRPVRDGESLAPGGEVVRLIPREGTPLVYDVKVEYQVPAASEVPARSGAGPAQVATQAYRDSWERTFGPQRRRQMAN